MHSGKSTSAVQLWARALGERRRASMNYPASGRPEEAVGVRPSLASDGWHPGAACCHRRLTGARRRRWAGITLIELMVVVAIVAILAAIAYPSYQAQIRKARRSVAKTALVEVSSRQEQFFQDRKTFAAVLTDLGYSADPFYLDKDGNSAAADSPSRIYEIDITAATATTFALEAVPLVAQAGDSCGTLTLDQAGVKGAAGPVSECW